MNRHLWLWAAPIFLVLFFALFYSQTLPNNRPLTRLDVWEALPFIYLNLIDPIHEEGAIPSGWTYFPQRLPMMGVAGFVLLGCWSMGGLALRGLNRWFGSKSCFTMLERETISIVLGLAIWSVVVLGLGLMGLLSQILFIILLLVPIGASIFQGELGMSSIKASIEMLSKLTGWQQLIRLALIPFVMAMILGALLPESDFDVKEYHIQGPKEFFQNGVITMLPHNVYTSFPFLTEMLSLSSMVIYGDWYWGALAGKCVLGFFGVLTALVVFAIGQRLFGEIAAWLGALIYLTTPWTYRISIIAYTEGGLSCMLAATLLVAVIATLNLLYGRGGRKEVLLSGMLAGAAVSCKYPGMVQVVIPIGVWLSAVAFRVWKYGTIPDPEKPIEETSLEVTVESKTSLLWIVPLLYLAGVLVIFGPWMAKNLVETGNPVYPLLYSVFGGTDWSAELDQKWKDAHYPHSHTISSFLFFVKDLPLVNDWQSVLVYGFAILTLPWVIRLTTVRWLWIYVGLLFLVWWSLTHRLDRFWVPMQPVVCVLAGAAFALVPPRMVLVYSPFVALALIFNLGFITSGLAGDNSYLYDLTKRRESSGKLTAPEVMAVNELTKGKVLCVGEAEVFDATFQPVYNTVFDRSIFEDWTSRPEDAELPSGDKKMKTSDEIKKILDENGIEYVLVNWGEILRYRTSYRYTDYVTPKRFIELVNGGVLKPALGGYPFFRDMGTFNDTERKEIESWSPELVVTIEGKKYFVTAQIFPVAR